MQNLSKRPAASPDHPFRRIVRCPRDRRQPRESRPAPGDVWRNRASRDQHRADHRSDPRNRPQDGGGLGQDGVRLEQASDPLFSLRDLAGQLGCSSTKSPTSAVPLFRPALFCSCTFLRISTSCPTGGRRRPEIAQLSARNRRPTSGRRHEAAGDQFGIDRGPKVDPALLKAFGLCRGSAAPIPAEARPKTPFAVPPGSPRSRPKAFLSSAMLSRNGDVFGKRSWRPSLKQWMSSQSRETSKPMISGCDDSVQALPSGPRSSTAEINCSRR